METSVVQDGVAGRRKALFWYAEALIEILHRDKIDDIEMRDAAVFSYRHGITADVLNGLPHDQTHGQTWRRLRDAVAKLERGEK